MIIGGQLIVLARTAEPLVRRARLSLRDTAVAGSLEAQQVLRARGRRADAHGCRWTRGDVQTRIMAALRALPDPMRDAVFAARALPNLIPNAAETKLRDLFNNDTGTASAVLKALKFHGLGTGATAAAEGDTALQTELTTEYNPDNTRATGSQTTNGANVYQTAGTNTVDGSATVTEWGLFDQAATGGGLLWSRIVFSGVALAPSNALGTTYELTIE